MKVNDAGREAHIHDDLRNWRPGRHRHPGVPGHAWLVPICSACPLAYTSCRPGWLNPHGLASAETDAGGRYRT